MMFHKPAEDIRIKTYALSKAKRKKKTKYITWLLILILLLILLLFWPRLASSAANPNPKIIKSINSLIIVEKLKVLKFPTGSPTPPVLAVVVQTPTPVIKTPYIAPSESTVDIDDNSSKLFIYNHESGNDPTRYNSSGCLGLGQACPASKLLNVCPNMDYACEDAWFSNYAIRRYGSWQGAYSFWIAHKWW